jgi:hypothetical protein
MSSSLPDALSAQPSSVRRQTSGALFMTALTPLFVTALNPLFVTAFNSLHLLCLQAVWEQLPINSHVWRAPFCALK